MTSHIAGPGTPGQDSAVSLTLNQWLQQMSARDDRQDSPYRIGGCGHLMLSALEEDHSRRHLRERVLPDLLKLSKGRPVHLLCGLAPGADLLFLQVSRIWFGEQGIPYEIIGLLPVPSEQLARDWVERANRDGYSVSGDEHSRLEAAIREALDACRTRVLLFKPDRVERLGDQAYRQRQYRLLGATLATQTDAMVGVLRGDEASLPGGTSEVMAWRTKPDRIPLSVWPAHRGRQWRRGVQFLIDPRVAPAAAEIVGTESRPSDPTSLDDEPSVILAAESAMASGNALLCNDLVFRAFERGLRSHRLAFLRIQSLANAGSHAHARRLYDELAPPVGARGAEWLNLLGRLEKDLGLHGGVSARVHIQAAAEAYLSAHKMLADSYPAINAATLFVLVGDLARARELAQAALALAISSEPTDAAAHYFAAATIAEARLILSDLGGARRALAESNRWLPADFAKRDRTRYQLALICRTLKHDPDVLSALELPPLVYLHREGHPQIAQHDDHSFPSIELPRHAIVFAALCDALDLSVLESLLKFDAHLYLSLPYAASNLVDYSYQHMGLAWGRRLEACLAVAQRVSVARGFLESERQWSAYQARRNALGLSVLAAGNSGARYQHITVKSTASCGAQLPSHYLATTLSDRDVMIRDAAARIPTTPPHSGRRMVGLIFADIAGFKRLNDPELPYFWNTVMRGVAELMAPYDDRVLLRQTWGDALHAVTADATTAAELAAGIQELTRRLVSEAGHPLSALDVRVAAHYAPAFEGHDPIRDARTYFGTQLTFTARIEPVTPPGQVYITESLAAQLAIDAPDRFSSEYVGEIQLAKRFGTYRVYTMRTRP